MTISQELNPDDEISLLAGMLLIRRLEEALIAEYPNQEMRCPVHFSIGQEAIAVGVSAFLHKEDWVVSNHRSHAHYIAKGGNLREFIAELYGKESGCCMGRGGSMHLTDLKSGFLGAIPIVGSSMPIAAGVAMSQQKNNSQSITVVYIGDATAETGSFHETLNFVSLHDIPLMTVCENNEFSVYSHLTSRQPKNRTIASLANSHGIKTFEGNGDDILEVVKIIREAKAYMVSMSKPVFIELKTYRLIEHCGPNLDDDLNYRDPEQVKNFKNRDPIKILLNKLYTNFSLTEKDFLKIDFNLKRDIRDLIDFAKDEPEASYSLSNRVYWSQS
jgi:pyruvate dehydrogenase E1 component alpha subunit